MSSLFALKLYEMVENESDEIISWVSNGNAFEVLNPKKLEEEVLPKFFRHGCFQSFVRQLNFYSFRKTIKDRSVWIYAHDCFVAGRPELLEQVKRKTNRGIHKRRGHLSSLDSLYNFKAKDLSQSTPTTKSSTRTRKRAYTDSQCDYYYFCMDDEKDSISTLCSDDSAPSTPASICSSKSDETCGDDAISRLSPVYDNDNIVQKKRRRYTMSDVADNQEDKKRTDDETVREWSAVHSYFIGEDKRNANSMSPSSDLQNSPSEPLVFTPVTSGNGESECHTPPDCEQRGRGNATDCDDLLLFCLKKDPWQRATDLYSDITILLAQNKNLESEMTLYDTALSPREQCDIKDEECIEDNWNEGIGNNGPGDNNAAPMTPRVLDSTFSFPNLSPRNCHKIKNSLCDRMPLVTTEFREITTVRMFISFALSCLHAAADHAGDDEEKLFALQQCAAKWGSYAQCCM